MTTPVRFVARPLLGALFVTGGFDALRAPGPRVQAVTDAGLDKAEQLVRINGAAMLLGGLGLSTGRVPRLSALVLASALVPTTVVGHPFWSAADKAAKTQQRIQFTKNLGLLGGLLLAVADTGGRESLPHAANRVSRRAARKAAKKAHKVRQALPV